MNEDSTKELSNNEMFRLILARLDSMDARLTTLEEKVDRRLMETRPIWESVLEQLKEVNQRIDRLETDYKDTRQMFRSGFDVLTRMQQDLNFRLLKVEETIQPNQ